MLKKIISFYKSYDIREKLIIISKKTGISFYPKQFKFKFIHELHAYIIFNLVFFKKIFEKKKNIYNFIKLNSQYKTSNVNFLISPQSSGSNFLRQSINVYFELSYKLGNGIPFYDNLNNIWISSGPAIVYGDMYRSINFHRNIALEKLDANLKKDFFSKRVIFTRHPTTHCDLFDLQNDNINPIILIREPRSWILSRYIYVMNNSYYSKIDTNKDNVNTKIIENEFSRLNFFLKYWLRYFEKKTKFMIFDYDDFLKNPNLIMFKVLEFFKYENINKEIIEKSIERNSKEFIQKFYGHLNMSRFGNPDEKTIIKKRIEKYVNEYLEKNDVGKNFKKLISLREIN